MRNLKPYFTSLLILTTQLLQLSSSSAVRTGVEEVQELLNLGDGIDFHGASQYTILMGSSGVGKSTLAKFLIQDPTLTVIKKGQNFLYADNDNTISTITRKSKTLLPNYYKDNETGQVIVDLPGFSDTREPQYEIAAAYFIKTVLESAKSLKLILVENMFSLTEGEDRYGLNRLVKHVAELIPNMAQFEGPVGVIATKVRLNGLSDEENVADILDFLRSFADDVAIDDDDDSGKDEASKAISRSQYQVLKNMIGQGDGANFGLFYRPNKAGSPWESYLGNKCWTSLRRLIFDDLPFKQVPAEAKFKYSLSVEGQVFVKENLLNTTNDRVYTEVENIFKYFQRNLELKLDVANTTGEKSAIAKVSNQEIKLFATNLRNLGELVPDLKKLQLLKNQDFHNMSFLVRKAEFFHGVIEKNTQSVVAEIKLVLKPYLKKALDAANFYSFLAELEVELDTYWPQYNRADLSTPLTQTNFRKIILNAEKHNLKISDKDSLYAVVPTKEMIDDLNRILSKHLDYKIYFKPNEYDLVIEGQHILISEIKNKMNASSRNQLKNIYIYGHKKIFVDESFTVQNANLSFASPVIEAVIKVPGIVPVIKTIGLDSTEVMPQAPRCKTPGLFGQRGQPGKAGGKAGNVLIAALEIKSPANMAIESKGGRGGPGQRGGDGCDGQTSPIPDYSPAARFGEFHDVYNHYSSRGYTVTVTNERAVQLSNYRQNIYPTQGGTGGEGGPGGNPGSVLIRTKETIDGLISQILSFGDSGEGGTGGTGGRGMARCSEAHLFCERHEEKKRRSGFNWARYNCQWFKKECDIIVTHTCRYVTAKLCPEMTPAASKGEKGGRSSLASNRPLPPQETVDTSPLKAEVAALASVVNSPQLKQLDTFIKSVL